MKHLKVSLLLMNSFTRQQSALLFAVLLSTLLAADAFAQVGTVNTWFSRAAVPTSNFNVTTAWAANADGTGANPVAGEFNDGTAPDNFVIQAGTTRNVVISANLILNNLTINSGGILPSSGGTVEIRGNLINNADLDFQVNFGASPVTFAGNSSASISGSQTINFGDVTVNKSAGANFQFGSNTVIVDFNFFVQSNFAMGSGLLDLSSANMVVSGLGNTVNFNNGTVEISASGTQSIESNREIVFNNFTVNRSGGIVTFVGSGASLPVFFRILGTYTRRSIFGQIDYNPTNATFGYRGNISTIRYDLNLSFSNATLINPEWVTIDSLRPRNAAINVGSANVLTIPTGDRIIDRDLALENGTLRFPGNAPTTDELFVGGNIVGTGTLGTSGSFRNGTIVLNGQSIQTQQITGGAGSLSRLRINRQAASDVVTLATNTLTVDTLIDVQQGVLQISSAATSVNFANALFRIQANGTYRTGGITVNTNSSTTFDFQAGSVFEFNGVGDASESFISVGGSGLGSYGNVLINRGIGLGNVVIPAASGIIINGNLTLTNRLIDNLAGGTLRVNGLVTGSATSFVNGPLTIRYLASDGTAKTFHVGKGGNYRPITLDPDASGFSAQTDFTVEQFETSPSGAGQPTAQPSGITQVFLGRHWTLRRTGTATGNYNLTATWTGTGFTQSVNRILYQSGGNSGNPNITFTVPGTQTTTTTTVSTGNIAIATNFPQPTGEVLALGEFTLTFKDWVGGDANWNADPNNWSPAGLPTASDNVRIGQTSFTNRTVTIPTGYQALSASLRLFNGSTLVITNELQPQVGATANTWDGFETLLEPTSTVQYNSNNLYADDYGNLVINGAIGTVGSGTISVATTLTKQTATAFSSSIPITVSTTYINTAGNATYNGNLTVIGSTTLTSGTVSNGSGTVTLNSNITVNGGQFGGTTNLGGVSTQTISGSASPIQFQNLTLNTGGGAVNIGSNIIGVSGNLVINRNNNIDGSGAGRILLNGSALQTISGTGSNPIFGLEIDNASGATLNRLLEISNQLTLTNGLINTTSTNLLRIATSSGGQLSPASYVNGPLEVSGSGTKVFPIGRGTTFRPVSVSATSSGNLRITLVNDSPISGGGTIDGTTITGRISNVRYWETNAAGIQSTSQITLSYSQTNGIGDGVLNPTAVVIATSDVLNGIYSRAGSGSTTSTLLGLDAITSSGTFSSFGNEYYTFGTNSSVVDNPLPVELVSFVGTGSRKGIELSWRTGSERESFGFVVNRRRAGGNWQVLDSYERNPSLRARNSLTGAEYFYIDRSPMNTGDVFEYRLDEVAFDGTVDRLKEIRVEAAFSTIVTDYALDQNYPNPFNPTTTVPYQLKDRGKVTLDIYNALGQKIATVVNAEQESGRYAPTFNAATLSSGMYFYRLQVVGARENFTQTRKMMLVK